jgi:hypothetical protein
MAPEQLIAGKPVDYHADIYALGAITYEMLAGGPPFTGASAQAIASKAVTEMPRSLTLIRDDIPHHVDAAVFGALRKQARERQSSAKEFARELNESPKPFDFAPAQRMSSGSLALGAVLTALLFGLAGYALGYRTHDSSDLSAAEFPVSMTIPGGTDNSDPDANTNRLRLLQITEDQVVDARVADGHVAYVTDDGSLWAAPFDVKRRVMTAQPVKVGSNVSITGTGVAQLAMSERGSVSYVVEEPMRLALIDRDGKLRYATPERRNFHSPRFSPDGKQISVDFPTPEGRDVWIITLATGALTQVTFDGDGQDASWTLDGRHIIYTSFRKRGIFMKAPTENRMKDSLRATAGVAYTGEWLHGGKQLVTTLTDLEPGSGFDIGIIENAGRGPVTPVLSDRFDTMYPSVSPDGKWLAYVSNQSGVQQVYVRTFESEGEPVPVSLTGGTEPVWGNDGREIFFRAFSDSDVDLVSAAVRVTPEFRVTSRRTLFPVSDMTGAIPQANYDLSPDGRTFVMIRRSSATRVMVIQNLAELLGKLRHR